MKRRPVVFDILKDTRGLAADRALVGGLPHVDSDAQSRIIKILIERGSEAGLRGLASLFDRLTPEGQMLVVSSTSRLFGALRSCVHSRDGRTRQNALDIVRRSGNTRLAYLAGHAIHDGSPKIRGEAAVSLLELTNNHFQSLAETTVALREATEDDASLFKTVSQTLKMLRDERQYLLTTLREALDHYESHHRPEVLEAAMLMADELESSLFKQSTVKRGKFTHAMLEILSIPLSPRFVPFVYVALGYPEMRRRIAPKLATCTDGKFVEEFIRWHWFARDPAIKKHLVSIRSLAWLDAGFEATFSLPPDVAPMAPSWILSLGLPSDQKVTLLSSFLLVDDPATNRAAVWALADVKTPASTAALEGITEHEDAGIRRIAAFEIKQRTLAGQHRGKRPELNGRPEAWINLLDRVGLSENFDDFWQNFEHIQPSQAQAAGHHVLEWVPGFATQVQIKFASKNVGDRLRALQLTVSLFVCKHFQSDIFAATNDESPEIRTTAMAAIGTIGGETSRRILSRTIHDDCPVVQAGAIDAIDQLKIPGRAELIASKTSSDDADVRAAAVRCLLKLRVPEAATTLISMLHDPRTDHRCAALWVADRLRLASIAPRITKIAQTDLDARIARIALHVSKRLERFARAAQGAPTASTPS